MQQNIYNQLKSGQVLEEPTPTRLGGRAFSKAKSEIIAEVIKESETSSRTGLKSGKYTPLVAVFPLKAVCTYTCAEVKSTEILQQWPPE